MVGVLFNTFERNRRTILSFGWAYSCVIVVCLFGPILAVKWPMCIFAYSLISVCAFIIAFITNFRFLYKVESGMAILLVSHFLMQWNGKGGLYSQSLGIGLYAFYIAFLCKLWTQKVYNIKSVDKKKASIEIVMALCFLIAFTALYLSNIFILLIPSIFISYIPLILGGVSLFYMNKADVFKFYVKAPPKTNREITTAYIFLIATYICGGISYAGIYGYFNAFANIDRYYNVLPLIIALPIAGLIGEKYALRHVFMIGTVFLGIAFAFFQIPHTVYSYFVTQTFLQMGWGFINVFGFSFAWTLGNENREPHFFAWGIVSILLGVFMGSVTAFIFNKMGLPINFYLIVTIIPLFICMALYILFIENRQSIELERTSSEISADAFMEEIEIQDLTTREKEIVFYYGLKERSAVEISELLNISPNTVRTHIKRSYSKLEVSSKRELKEKLKNLSNH